MIKIRIIETTEADCSVYNVQFGALTLRAHNAREADGLAIMIADAIRVHTDETVQVIGPDGNAMAFYLRDREGLTDGPYPTIAEAQSASRDWPYTPQIIEASNHDRAREYEGQIGISS